MSSFDLFMQDLVKTMKNSLKRFFNDWGVPLLFLIVLFLLVPFIFQGLPKVLVRNYENIFTINKGLTPDETGPIGDTFGGLLGPVIAIIAAFLTFVAFWVQYRANEQQRKDIQIERFENKFYEMLRLHRDNVAEMKIKTSYEGRRVFVEMYNEFRFCFYAVKKVIEEYPVGTNEKDLGFKPDDDEKIAVIAYLIFFHGTGDKSDRLQYESLNKLCSVFFLPTLIEKIKQHQRDYSSIKKNKPDGLPKLKIEFKDGSIYETHMGYKPFSGHLSRLGHYYRHLFQTVKFVALFDKIDFNFKERYEYLKTLRAQLSSHEQVLLYYNCLTPFGSPWLNPANPFLTQYKMIKNLPLPLADFGIKPEIKFAKEIEELKNKGEVLFEWNNNNGTIL